jgi:hypothetical protein
MSMRLAYVGGAILYGFYEIPNTGSEIPLTGNVSQPAPTATPTPLPTDTTVSTVSFANDVLPIMKSRCINCHGGQKMEEGLDLTSYQTLMAGSDNGPAISPGDANNSPLGQTLIEREMPKRGPKLKPDQAQLIIDWINAGCGESDAPVFSARQTFLARPDYDFVSGQLRVPS